jgi:hypothetical protein
MGEPPPKPPLEYDRTATTVTVRGFRTLLLLLVINTMMLGWFVVGPQATRFAQQQWRQYQGRREQGEANAAWAVVHRACATHAFPADYVAYEERPDRVLGMLAGGGDFEGIPFAFNTAEGLRPIRAKAPPPHWITMLGEAMGRGGAAASPELPLVFLHERTSANGARRIVAVQFGASINDDGNGRTASIRRHLEVSTFKTTAGDTNSRAAAAIQDRRLVRLSVRGEEPIPRANRGGGAPETSARTRHCMTVLAGQPDPADASHFTIPYLIDGRAGVIDAWLRDEGIDFKPRTGQPTFIEGEPAWELEAPAAATTATTTATTMTTMTTATTTTSEPGTSR